MFMERELTHYIYWTISKGLDANLEMDCLVYFCIMTLWTLMKYVPINLIFHIDKCKIDRDAWDNVVQLYVKVDEIKGILQAWQWSHQFRS